MKFCNPIFKTKKVRQFISDLIHDYDYDSYSDLSNGDKAELTALLIDCAGRHGEHECIVESNNFDQMINTFKKALCGTKDDDEAFLEVIKTNAIEYYDETMELLFDEYYEDYQSDLRETAKYGDPDDAYESYREAML